MTLDKDDIELAFIREFSHSGNQIGRTAARPERRERVRQAIYIHGKANERFEGEGITYAEAFRVCYGERLDRRAAARALPDTQPEAEDDNEPDNE